jgi:hypothetical protein
MFGDGACSVRRAVSKGLGLSDAPWPRSLLQPLKKSWLSLALWLAASNGVAAADLMSAARVHPPYRGIVPTQSDVIFSTRFTRPEAIPVIRRFSANRVEWVYTSDAEFAGKLRQIVPWFGGTLNGTIRLPSDAGYVRDFDGKVIGPPWATGWGSSWVTTTHADTQMAMQEQVRGYVNLGASSIQHDEPQVQFFPALHQGGDFNESTVAGFPHWLATQADPVQVQAAGLTGFGGNYRDWLAREMQVKDADDYRKRHRGFPSTPLWLEYLQSTALEHHARIRQQAERLKGTRVPISMNFAAMYEPLASNQFFFLASAADYAMSETAIDDPALMVSQALTARALGLGFAPSIMPRDTAQNRVAIAFLYALGGQVVVPWDVYDGNDATGKARRFFGAPDDYADLYAFVRSNPGLFDGFEATPVVGVVVPVDKGRQDQVRALSRRLVAQQVPFAFVPVGGRDGYRVAPARLRHLRLLITTNPEADYSGLDLKAMRDSGTLRVYSDALRDEHLVGLRPFQVAPGAERLRLVARANPDDPDRLVVHVVDASRGATASEDASCRRRLGIRRDMLGTGVVAAATWHSPSKRRDLTVDTSSATHVYFGVTGCAGWSVLDLRMSR